LVLRAFMDQTGGLIKSLAPNQLVSSGIEGHGKKYGFGGDEGNDFVTIHSSPGIDICSVHPYPSESWANLDINQTTTLYKAWAADAQLIVKKPLIIGEFNVHKASNFGSRADYWKEIFHTVEGEDGIAGDLVWWYTDQSNDDYSEHSGDLEMTLFTTHSTAMNKKSGGAPGPLPTPPPTLPPPSCSDVPPPSPPGGPSYTCDQQKGFGKCDVKANPWMLGYCCQTCFGCAKSCTSVTPPSPPPSPPGPSCTDVGPDSNSCAQQKEWGKCDVKANPWMAGYCCKTCFNCAAGCGKGPAPPAPPPAPSCTDTPPDGASTCAQQKEWGKCDAKKWPWMAGYCCKTCFNCDAKCGH